MNLKHLSSNVTCYSLTKLRLWWCIMIYRLLVRIYSNFTLNGYKIAVCESKTIHFGIYDSRWFSWKWFKKFFSLSTFVLRSKTNDWWNKWYFFYQSKIHCLNVNTLWKSFVKRETLSILQCFLFFVFIAIKELSCPTLKV